MIYELVLRNFNYSLEFVFSLLLLQPFNFSPISFACNFQDWECVILREIDFLLKICWSIPCLHPSWKVRTWLKVSDTYQMLEKKLSKSYFSSPAHMWIWILCLSARQNKASKSTRLYSIRRSWMRSLQNAAKNSHWSKTSHKSKNHTEVYITVFFVLLRLKLNKIRWIMAKDIFICSYLDLNEDWE